MSQSPPSPATPPRPLRLAIAVVDRTTDALTFVGLVAMVIVISWQVFARFFLGFTPGWASEVALLLLCWLAFLAIAKGIRERSHVAVGLVVDRLPRGARSAAGGLVSVLTALFGLYLVVQGGQFTALMTQSTLPATGLPTAVQYAVMPVAGVLIVVYSVLALFGCIPTDAGASASDADTATPGEGDAR